MKKWLNNWYARQALSLFPAVVLVFGLSYVLLKPQAFELKASPKVHRANFR